MRIFLLILFIQLAFNSQSQYTFSDEPEDRNRYFETEWFGSDRFGIPNFDSVTFEFRLWAFGNINSVVILSQLKNSSWIYTRGYYDDNQEFQELPLMPSPKIDSIWNILQGFGVLKLADQKELIYEYTNEGRTIKLGPENEMSERIVHSTLDGTGYLFQLISSEKYRDYYYYEPLVLNFQFQKSGKWKSPETQYASAIIKSINQEFRISELFKHHLNNRK